MSLLFTGGAFLLFFVVWAGLVGSWIWALVDVARTPDAQFRAAGTDKVAWVLVVALGSFVGALVWWFAKRADVRRFAGYTPPPPAGWYPEGPDGSLRYWDGAVWTEHRHPAPQ